MSRHSLHQLRVLDMEICRLKRMVLWHEEKEKNLSDSEKRLLTYKNEPRARRKEEIDEELRRLGDSDPRKRLRLNVELMMMPLEDSPLERVNDFLNQLLQRAAVSNYLDERLDDALLWEELRHMVKIVRRHLKKRILESSSSTPIAAHRKEDQDLRFFISGRAARKLRISSKLKKLYGIQTRYLEATGFKPHSGNFWELACYPMKSDFFLKKRQVKSLVSELKPLLESAIPKYPEDLKEVVSGSQPPDLVSLLSSPSSSGGSSSLLVRNHGNEEVVVLDGDTFRGKYVLVCCFHVPVLWTPSFYFQALISLCEELYATQGNFEMVAVARMNMLADTQAVFDHFFSGMPSSCLAVPYKDLKRREHICKLIGLDPSTSLSIHFVGPDGRVLPTAFKPLILNKYGAEAFPFTGNNGMKRIRKQQKKMLADGKLIQLLKPPQDAVEDDLVVCQFNPGGAPQPQPLLGVTGGKHVGLYICCVGSLVPVLRQVHDECRRNNCHFEIVVLFCPSFEALDPKVHREKMYSEFERHDVSGWWCLPFNNSVSLRFLDITSFCNTGGSCPADMLLVVGGDGRILDVYGAEVIRSCTEARSGSGRVTDSHPFTRQTQVDGLYSKLREITLESLLDGPLRRGAEDKTTVGELRLKGCKKIIVFMDYLRHVYHENFLRLKDRYLKLKQEHGDEFEVVFFDSMESAPAAIEDYESAVVREMPWYVYPVDGTRSLSFLKLTGTLCRQALYGFGDDGKLCSYESIGFDRVDLRLTNDITLRQDIVCHLGYPK